jgi:hypothetical protein
MAYERTPEGIKPVKASGQVETGSGNGDGRCLAVTSRRDGKSRGDPIFRRGKLCRVQNPMSATGMKQGRDGRERNKALRG